MSASLPIALATWIVSRADPVRLEGGKATLASPMVQLERSADALRESLRRTYPSWSPEAELQRGAVDRIVSEAIDYREFGRRTLGVHWKGLSDDDRTAFIIALGRLIKNRCLAQEGVGPDLKIRFDGETVSPQGTATVSATVSGNPRTKKLRISIEYRLLWESDHWSIYDLLTDGQSLVDSYRAQFDRIIARESFEGLLRRMKHQADLQ